MMAEGTEGEELKTAVSGVWGYRCVCVCDAAETRKQELRGCLDDEAIVLVSTNCLPNMPIVHILSGLGFK